MPAPPVPPCCPLPPPDPPGLPLALADPPPPPPPIAVIPNVGTRLDDVVGLPVAVIAIAYELLSTNVALCQVNKLVCVPVIAALGTPFTFAL